VESDLKKAVGGNWLKQLVYWWSDVTCMFPNGWRSAALGSGIICKDVILAINGPIKYPLRFSP